MGLHARISSFCQFLKPHAIVFIVVRNFHLGLVKQLLLLLLPPLLLLIFLFHKPLGYNYKRLNWKGHQSLSCAIFHFGETDQEAGGDLDVLSFV